MIIKLALTVIFFTFLISCNNNEQNNSPEIKETQVRQLTSPADTASAEPYLFTDKNGLVCFFKLFFSFRKVDGIARPLYPLA